jgi:hypothetical protein
MDGWKEPTMQQGTEHQHRADTQPWTAAMLTELQQMLRLDDVRQAVAIWQIAEQSLTRDPEFPLDRRERAGVRAEAFGEVLAIIDGKVEG